MLITKIYQNSNQMYCTVCIDKYFLMGGMNALFRGKISFLLLNSSASFLNCSIRLTKFAIKFDGIIHPGKYALQHRDGPTRLLTLRVSAPSLVLLQRLLISNPICSKSTLYSIEMSKMKEQTFRYRFGNETKTFGIVPTRICLVKNSLFRSGPESALRRFGFIPV